MPTKSKSIFAIGGMHRSGTSLVAGWLSESGYFLGNEMLEAASSNPKGHFEDMEILDFHCRALESRNYHRSGLTIKNVDFEFEESEFLEAKRLIENRSNLNCWGWKEPRTCLFINSWKKILPQLKVVIIFRKPELVVSSLYKRLKRNKWYYTRNPLKRLVWYLDIDLNPKKWYQIFSEVYAIYNQSLIDFHEHYPNDSIIFEIEDILKEPDRFNNELKSFLKTEKDLISFHDFYEKRYLRTNSDLKNINIGLSANLAYDQLKKLSVNS